MIFKDKELQDKVDNMEIVIAKLIDTVNEQTIALQALSQQDANRVVFRGFGFKEKTDEIN